MKTIVAISTMLAAIIGNAAAQPHTLNTSRDDTPDGAVIFTLNLPYAFSKIHPDAAKITLSCEINIGLPQTAGGATFNFNDFSGGGQSINLAEIAPGPDGFRSATGTMTFRISVPAEDATNMLRPEARSNYRCDVGIDDDPTRSGVYTISNSTADNLSYPHWAKGTSSGRPGGAINLPAAAARATPTATPNIDPDLIKRKSPLPKRPLTIPKKD